MGDSKVAPNRSSGACLIEYRAKYIWCILGYISCILAGRESFERRRDRRDQLARKVNRVYTWRMPKPFRILSPTALLGYGFPDESLAAGLRAKPDLIAVDAGSTDGGPGYLGYELGQERGGDLRAFLEPDLRRLLGAARAHDIPLVIGSAGIAGGDVHLLGTLAVIQSIAEADGLSFPMGIIQAEIDKGWMKARLAAGEVYPCGPVPPLTAEDIDGSVRLVAQMGWEPIAAALDAGAEVVLAGRASDPAVFAALPILRGYDPGLALHLAKILECGAIAAEPGSGSDGLLGTLYGDRFTVEPLGDRACTVRSVAGHTLYEQGDPTRIDGPGGYVDLSDVVYRQDGPRRVEVKGSRFISKPYRVKVEGARKVGYRAIAGRQRGRSEHPTRRAGGPCSKRCGG